MVLPEQILIYEKQNNLKTTQFFKSSKLFSTPEYDSMLVYWIELNIFISSGQITSTNNIEKTKKQTTTTSGNARSFR